MTQPQHHTENSSPDEKLTSGSACRTGDEGDPNRIHRRRTQEERWKPVRLSELTGSADVPWLWVGYIAAATITLFTGLWKAGKTTLLAHLVRALVAGDTEFAGRAVLASKVLIVTEESPQMWVKRRDELDISDDVQIVSRPFIGRASPKDWEKFVHRVAKVVREDGINLVVFDSLPNLWPVQDENDAANVIAALSPLNGLTEAGSAVLLLAHPRKGDAKEGQATRGSGGFMGFVDVIIEMRRFDPERKGDTRRVLTAYSRFDETPEELVLDYDSAAGYQASGVRADATASDRRKIVRAVLSAMPNGATLEDLLAAWPTEAAVAKPGSATLKRDLNPPPDGIVRMGDGKKGSPYYYHVQPLREGVAAA